MQAAYVPPVRTQVNASELRDALRYLLTERVGLPDDHTLDTLIAMSAHETGNWKSCWNYNLGNAKAGETYQGEFTCLSNVREIIKNVERWFDPDGEIEGKNGPPIGPRFPVPPGHPATRFRAYDDFGDGAAGWVDRLARGYRESLELLMAGASTDEFIASLKNQGYFTGDLAGYQRSVAQLYRQYGGAPKANLPLVK